MTSRMLPAVAALLSLGSVARAADPVVGPPRNPAPATLPASRPTTIEGADVQIVRWFARVPNPHGHLDLPIEAVRDGAAEPGADPALKRAAAWIAIHREALVGTTANGVLPASPWGESMLRPARAGQPTKLYLHVFDHHASGKVIAYGLSGDNVKRAYLFADPKSDLKVEKTPRDTVVEVTPKNAKAPDPIDTVVVLELDGEPKINPLAVAPAADGSIVLHSSQAIVAGKNLRYEPEPNKNTLGYWTNPADGASWRFKVEKAGTYEVEALQGCGKNSGGSDVEFVVGDQVLPMVVQDTGHFQNFVPRAIGKVKLEAGEHTLAVRVKQKKGAAVMDLRQVTLKPAGG